MAKKPEKTNAMRLLDQKKVQYTVHDYSQSGMIAGEDVAKVLGEDPSQVFKTLVARGDRTGIHVFCIPVCFELDLKKAAKAVGDKKIELVAVKELLALTGYIRGGCSPIGMKKHFPTYIHHTCEEFPYIFVSAGVRGLQLKIAPADLMRMAQAEVAEII